MAQHNWSYRLYIGPVQVSNFAMPSWASLSAMRRPWLCAGGKRDQSTATRQAFPPCTGGCAGHPADSAFPADFRDWGAPRQARHPVPRSSDYPRLTSHLAPRRTSVRDAVTLGWILRRLHITYSIPIMELDMAQAVRSGGFGPFSDSAGRSGVLQGDPMKPSMLNPAHLAAVPFAIAALASGAGITSAQASARSGTDLPLIPMPASVVAGQGALRIGADTPVVAASGDAGAERAARFLAERAKAQRGDRKSVV